MTVLAAIEPAVVQVDAGGSASVSIRVRNQSERVDGFRIEIVGPVAEWATVDPPLMQLFPRTEGEARITFTPPRASTPHAGSLAFGVRIQSTSDAAVSTVEEGHVSLGPFVVVKSELRARVARGWRSATHTVVVRNVGNDTARVAARAIDPEEELRVSIGNPQLAVAPDGEGTLEVAVTARRLLFRGSPRRLPYSIDVSEATAGTERLSAVFEQRPLIPGWAILAAGLIVAAALAPVLYGLITGGDATATQSPTPTFTPTPTTLVTPTPTPTETPTPTPSPTPTPTPTPMPTPFTGPGVTITGFDPLMGDHPAINQRASYSPDGTQLYIELTLLIDPSTCYVQLRVPVGLVSTAGTFAIGSWTDPSVPGGRLSCGPDDPTYESIEGSLAFTETDSQVSGTFFFDAASEAVRIMIERGEFADVEVEPG